MVKFGFQTEGIKLVQEFHDQVKGRTFLITGPSKGGKGARKNSYLVYISLPPSPRTLLILSRSLDRIQSSIGTIHSIDDSITTKLIPVDISSFTSARHAASQILNDPSTPQIGAIINNTAIVACPYSLAPEGVEPVESQLAANCLGHFLLTNLLMHKILAS